MNIWNWLCAQFRYMHPTESVNYRLRYWLREPVKTWRVWKAHHTPLKLKLDPTKISILRLPDESDADFRARMLRIADRDPGTGP